MDINGKKDIAAIYAAGLSQGLALVAFPAASTILTSSSHFNFSSTEYSSLFLPQVFLAILVSVATSKLSKELGSKVIYLLGLLANLIAMGLLASSLFVMQDRTAAYGLLLSATGFLGLGFGLTVPTLNMIAAVLNPEKVDSTILILNALLGVGTAASPLLSALFIWLGFWWGFPLLIMTFIFILLIVSFPLTLPGGRIKTSYKQQTHSFFPYRLGLFIAFAVLYGFIETLNGNWVLIYMHRHENAAATTQALALTSFWGMVTGGRIFFALIKEKFSEQRTYQLLPFIAAVALIFIALLPSNTPYWGILAFGLAGLGCSALLPLTISFGTQHIESIDTAVAGKVIAFYLFGYGVAAFGVGPLLDTFKLDLQVVYGMGAGLSFVLGGLATLILKAKEREQT